MAAAVQGQIRNIEGKLKPFLREGPFDQQWGFIEKKTTVRREQVALGLLGVLAIYLAFGWGNDFLCNLIGFLYPGYASVIAVESRGTSDDTEWLIYWVVYALFGIIEYVGHNFFHSLPFYWLGKCLFLIWLMMPGSKNGSQLLYHKVIHPLVAKIRPSTGQKFRTEASEYISKNTD